MKTDKFNDAIRKKLDSIQPSFKEQDWGKLKSFMDGQSPPTFWQQYGNSLFYVASAASVTILIITNLLQNIENKTLRQNIQVLSQKVEVLEKEAILKRDTIHTTIETYSIDNKDIVKKQSKDLRSIQNLELLDDDNAVSNNEPEQKSIKNANQGSIRENANSQNIAGTSNNSIEIEADNFDSKGVIKKENKNKIENIRANELATTTTKLNNNDAEQVSYSKFEKNSSISTKRSKNSKTSKQNLQNARYNNVDFNSTIEDKAIQNVISKDVNGVNGEVGTGIETQTQTLAFLTPIDSVNLNPDLPIKRIRVRAPRLATFIKEPKRSFKLSLPFALQMGVSYNLGHAQKGFGLWTEAFITDRFSIGIGLDKVVWQENRFISDRSFAENRHEDFRNNYAPRVPLNHEISNIGISEDKLLMPIFVNYRFPLKYNFSLVTSLGTSLNLKTKQNIEFNIRRGPAEYEDGEVHSNISRPMFTNIITSVGIEKSYKSFVFQALPTMNFNKLPTRPNDDDTNIKVNFGLKLRALFKFGG